ncbi:MAG: sigma-70 family RNA polymerase sigma factor [Chitinophagaceae bacterium]|nr:sigma-70 family RNA polymerase sigma factor [Chitinophagaceae bacterium]
MENREDNIWIEQILNGDEMPFRHLVEKYQNLVFAIAFRILGNREDAEDAAQEIFVKCFHGLGKFNKQAAFSTWLYKIAFNHSLDLAKKFRHSKYKTDWEKAEIGSSITSETRSESEMDSRIIKSILKGAIDSLPPESRIIVLLYYYENLSLKEISEIMGFRENNLKIKLHRIRSKLMKQLQTKEEIISTLNL